MKIHRYIETIPEHKVERVEFVASDGKKFTTEEECREYERKLNLDVSKLMFNNRIATNMIYPEDSVGELFLLTSESDYIYMLNHVEHDKKEQDDFKKFGPGFYLMYVDDKGNYRLHCLEYYIDLLEKEFTLWKSNIESMKRRLIDVLQEFLISHSI